MGRRFRLSVHRKNEFRKNLQRTVIAEHVCTVTVSSNSVSSSNPNGLSSEVLQCDKVLTPPNSQRCLQAELPSSNSSFPHLRSESVSSLAVSIPIKVLKDCDVTSLACLQKRLVYLSILQQGMYIWFSNFYYFISHYVIGWLDTSDTNDLPIQDLILTKVETLNGTSQVISNITHNYRHYNLILITDQI